MNRVWLSTVRCRSTEVTTLGARLDGSEKLLLEEGGDHHRRHHSMLPHCTSLQGHGVGIRGYLSAPYIHSMTPGVLFLGSYLT